GRLISRKHGPQIHHQSVGINARYYGRRLLAQSSQQFLRATAITTNGNNKSSEAGCRSSAAADNRFALDNFNLAAWNSPKLADNAVCPTSDFLGRSVDHLQSWNRTVILTNIGEERCFERGISELIDPQCAKQRIGSHALDQFRASGNHAGMWTAEK